MASTTVGKSTCGGRCLKCRHAARATPLRMSASWCGCARVHMRHRSRQSMSSGRGSRQKKNMFVVDCSVDVHHFKV